MRLLIIEDEKKTAAYLKKGLTENAFTVDVAEDGESGLFLGVTGDYDLIILDIKVFVIKYISMRLPSGQNA